MKTWFTVLACLLFVSFATQAGTAEPPPQQKEQADEAQKRWDEQEYFNRGVAWLDKGEYDKAISDFNQALAINPKCGPTYYNRGTAWKEKGEYDKAIADFNDAIRLDLKLVEAYNNRGESWRN